ncbi:MAG: DUF6249 domain-containing protein, partial [Flavipsychrobacter sp.]
MHDLVPIVLFISMFATIFGIVYIRSRENMAMLEKGLNPRENRTKIATQPFMSLKFGLLLVGAGLGLFAAYLFDVNISAAHNTVDSSPLYPSLIGIGGGLGLIISYLIERRYMEK